MPKRKQFEAQALRSVIALLVHTLTALFTTLTPLQLVCLAFTHGWPRC